MMYGAPRSCGETELHDGHDWSDFLGVGNGEPIVRRCYGVHDDAAPRTGETAGAPERAAQRAHGTLDGMTPELSRVSDELYVDVRRVLAVRHSTLSGSAVLVLDGGHELTVHGQTVEQTVAALRTALGMAD